MLSSGAGGPIPFRVLLDGEAPGPRTACDVDEDGRGLLREGRLYQLVREPGDGRASGPCRSLFEAPGAEAYAFTFG